MSQRLNRTQSFRRFILAGLALALSYHYAVSLLPGKGWPETSFLFRPDDRFMDLLGPVVRARSQDPYFTHGVLSPPNYLPFTYIALRPLSWLPPGWWVITFMATTFAGFVLIASWWSRRCFEPKERALATLNMALGMIASYPFLFALDRGNLDLWVALLVFVFVTCDHFDWAPSLGGFALAMATAVKIYPAAFVVLLVARRRCFRAAAVLAVAGLLTLFSAAALPGGVPQSLWGFGHALLLVDRQYVVGDCSLHYSCDPYNGLRAACVCLGWGLPGKLFVEIYDILSSCCVCVCVGFLLIARLPAWRRTSILAAAVLLFPNIASDYKLLILLPGIVQFLVDDAPMRLRERLFFGLCMLLLIPKHYLFWKGDVGLSCVLSPILLLSLVVVLVADGPAWKSVMLCVFRPVGSECHKPA